MTTALAPIVRVEAGAVFANSRDGADFFGKHHRDVLRDVRKLAAALNAQNCAHWFTPSTYQAKVGYGLRTSPAFNMTKDGFALLVMGFTGTLAQRMPSASHYRGSVGALCGAGPVDAGVCASGP